MNDTQPQQGPEGLRCVQCEHVHFPPRHVCPQCHGRQFTQQPLRSGVIEEITTPVAGVGVPASPVRIASIRTDQEPHILARVHGELQSGDSVGLSLESGKVTARASQ